MDSFYVLHVADQDDLEDVEEGGAGGLASKMTKKVSDARLRHGRRCGGRGTRRSGPRSGVIAPSSSRYRMPVSGQHRRDKAGMRRAVGK